MKKRFLKSVVFAILIVMGITGAWLVSSNLPESGPVNSVESTPSISTLQHNPLATPSLLGVSTEIPELGQQTKFTNCQAHNALPDVECTPGAIIPTATKEDICTSGYSQTVRNVSQKTKDQVYAMYGVLSHVTGEYEVDHLVSLELGGSNDVSNLWPEPAEPHPGFHEKDKIENYLHSQVCAGVISLSQAQKIIATDWMSVYDQLDQ